jgi:hypothetical protein
MPGICARFVPSPTEPCLYSKETGKCFSFNLPRIGVSGFRCRFTSGGKTRSVEIVLRSAFLSGRARIAVVVAPFKALCREIGTTLRQALKATGLKVNELSDAIQLGFLDQIAELLGNTAFIVSNTRTPVECACAAPYRTARRINRAGILCRPRRAMGCRVARRRNVVVHKKIYGC